MFLRHHGVLFVALLPLLSAPTTSLILKSKGSAAFAQSPGCLRAGGHASAQICESRLHASVFQKRKSAVPGWSCSLDGAGAQQAESTSIEVESKFWEWKEGWTVHYKHYTGSLDSTGSTERPRILLLPGFGVGEFHYSRNVEELVEQGMDVWAMDVLGQGRSWPSSDPAPGGSFQEPGFQWGFGAKACDRIGGEDLTYSCTLWRDQAISFLDSVVGSPTYIAGNSLGGYLAAMIASERPDLVKGLFLLNPTPFWGVGVQRILPWEGGYPVPKWVRPVVFTWWDTIRSPSTIENILSQVYASPGRVGQDLISQIIQPTEAPAAASAFASILCSPPSSISFENMLQTVKKEDIPVGLCYGKEDPWIVPLWGHRAKRELPEAEYWEISPAGHCPHHEAPEAVNYLMSNWVKEMEIPAEARSKVVPVGSTLEIDPDEKWGTSASFAVKACDGAPRNIMEWIDDRLAGRTL